MSVETFRGEPIASGFAVGLLEALARDRWTPLPESPSHDPRWELDRFRQQVGAVERRIATAIERLESEALRSEAEIMRTHLMMLRDPALHRQVCELIHGSCHRAETAVEHVLRGMAAILADADDPILAERAVDVRDLAMRLSAGLAEQRPLPVGEASTVAKATILALPELMPSVVLEARERGVTGFVVEHGTTVSHGAILAKSFGMPVIRVACLASVMRHAGRDVLVWDGGEVLVEPSDAELAARRPPREVVPVGRSGRAAPVRVWISIVDPDQLLAMDWSGIEGVGLYRSEALFMRHGEDFPGEEEQLVTYRKLFQLAGRGSAAWW